jgi:hypothetical protein
LTHGVVTSQSPFLLALSAAGHRNLITCQVTLNVLKADPRVVVAPLL